MSVDRLIGELRREGRVDSRGEFTLDRDKAREKLRRYQLASLQAYVTELVQAAVLRGATRIEVEIEDDAVSAFRQVAAFAREDRTDVAFCRPVTHHHRVPQTLHELGVLRPPACRYLEEDVTR